MIYTVHSIMPTSNLHHNSEVDINYKPPAKKAPKHTVFKSMLCDNLVSLGSTDPEKDIEEYNKRKRNP